MKSVWRNVTLLFVFLYFFGKINPREVYLGETERSALRFKKSIRTRNFILI